KLPDKRQYNRICQLLYENRELPEYFPEDVIMKNPSRDVMNKLARAVLTLYSYDDDPDDLSLENNMRQSISLIARMPAIMTYAYQVKRRHFDKQTMFFHPFEPQHKTAEAILNALREDRSFTREEAELLDLCMVLHAEHGGGNNSTFTARVLSSAHTDIYSTIAASIGSLKGFRHGGANHKVRQMMDDIMRNVQHWDSEDEVEAYLERILRREVGDKSGLIYGVGHAIYTLSDPRAVELKKQARVLAGKKGYGDKFALYERIEKLAPAAFKKVTGNKKVICANVDFYSGLVYEMLGIPEDLFTPMFAVSRIAGWCAHRIEELTTGGRIIRPAYRALPTNQIYVPLEDRHY
ncbi:MAG: citrate synthase, partial [Hominenteromicrobium sp.]